MLYFFFAISSAISTWFLFTIFFVGSFVLGSTFIFVYLLSSAVVIKAVVSGISFSISVAFISRKALVARLVILGILIWPSVAFVFGAVLASRLGISGNFLSILWLLYGEQQ